MRALMSPARIAFVAVMAAGLWLVLYWNLPGHLSVDSVLALKEGRFGVRETWNPAIFGWLLGRFDAITPGTAAAVTAMAALLFGAWAAMSGLRTRVSWLAAPLALLALGLPQVVIFPGIVWKDVWFAQAAIAGFVLLAFAVGAPRGGRRLTLLALAALALALAGLLRQNGLILAVAGAVALAWTLWGDGARRAVLGAAGWLAAIAALVFALSVLAQPQGFGRPDAAGAKGLHILQVYDLAGAATRADLPLDRLAARDPTLDDVFREKARTLYAPDRVDTLNNDRTFGDRLAKAPPGAVQGEWLSLILTRPQLYLETRWEAFRWVVATPDIDKCLPIHVGAVGPPAAMAALDMPVRQDLRDFRLYNYVTWFLDTPVYSHLVWGGVALVAGLILLLRRDPADIVVAGLMFGSLAFAASFFVVSLACDYRYLYLLDLAGLTGALYLALDPTLRRQSPIRARSRSALA
jgi:hypothetical protein